MVRLCVPLRAGRGEALIVKKSIPAGESARTSVLSRSDDIELGVALDPEADDLEIGITS